MQTDQERMSIASTEVYEHFLDVVEHLKTGEFVFSAQKYQLETAILIWPDLFKSDQVHISKSGGGVNPYFLNIHPNQFTPNLESDLNQLYLNLFFNIFL